MRRFVSIPLAALSIAIALVAVSIAWQSAHFDGAGVGIEAANPAAGVAFYAGLNRALAGEGDDQLQAVVTEDFVDHPGSAEPGREASALIDRLTALGQTFPGIQLKVTNILSSGGDLIVDVVPVAPAPGQIAGLTLTPAHLTGGIEVLQVRRGKVSARWASTLPPLSATTFDVAAHSYYTEIDISAHLYRIELPPGSELSWRADNLSVAMVESGSLAISVEKLNEMETSVTETETHNAGEAVSIPTAAQLRLRSHSAQGATLLLFTAHSVTAELPRGFRLEGGAHSTLLWNSPAPFALTQSARVQIGRIELPVNMEIELASASEMEIVASTQGGSLGMRIEHGTALQRNEQYAIVPVESPLVLAVGGAVQISQANGVNLSASSGTGVSIWLVTIGPSDPEGSDFEQPPGGHGRQK